VEKTTQTQKMNKSKFTTYCGLTAAAAGCVAAANFSPLVTKISSCVMAIAVGWMGYVARDNKITDEQAGAKQTTVNNNNENKTS
jgi:hypothetical protein